MRRNQMRVTTCLTPGLRPQATIKGRVEKKVSAWIENPLFEAFAPWAFLSAAGCGVVDKQFIH
jgi:hypothetical protein